MGTGKTKKNKLSPFILNLFPCFIWRFLLKVRKPDSQSGNGLFDSAKRHQYGVMDKGKSLDSQSRGAWSFHAHVTNMVRSTSGLGRRPLKAETHVRIVRESPYGCLDKGKSPASQAGGGGSYATSNHHQTCSSEVWRGKFPAFSQSI